VFWWWDPLLDVPAERPDVDRPGLAKGPDERSVPLGGLEAVPVEVQVRTAAWQPPQRVGCAGTPDHDHTEQVSRICTDPASHTHALRACASPRSGGHRAV
jgi:hypothetical protein